MSKSSYFDMTISNVITPCIKFPLNSVILKDFRIYSFSSEKILNQIKTFMNENRMIEELRFASVEGFQLINDQLQNEFSCLKDIVYADDYCEDYEKIILKYLPYLDFLKSFSFLIKHNEDIDDQIITLCANKWRVCRTNKIINTENIVRDMVRLERIEKIV